MEERGQLRSIVTLLTYTIFIHSLVFSLEGRAWQEPEPSHVTGMALAHCILGKFLGVVCHCFPPLYNIYQNCTFCKLIYYFLIFDIFYMFRTREFTVRKTVIYAGTVECVLHAVL